LPPNLRAMMTLPGWMRRALFATAFMNFGGAAMFLPAARGLRELLRLPVDAHPLYLLTVALFVALFGAGYFWSARTRRVDPMFMVLAIAGKLGFFVIAAWLWAGGQLSAMGPLLASGDLFFAAIFLFFLLGARTGAVAHSSTVSVPR
jgi:hypothetical protein